MAVERFKVLTDYIGKISVADSLGEWVIDRENDGPPERPFQMPYVNFSELANSFMDEFYRFSKSHPEYELTNYSEILRNNGLAWGADEMRSADLSKLDEKCVLALIMGAIRAERFCDGAFLGFLNDGSLTLWLKRLKDIDWAQAGREAKKIIFEVGGFFQGYTGYTLTFTSKGAKSIKEHSLQDGASLPQILTTEEAAQLRVRFSKIHTEYWNAEYNNADILDGEQWNLTVHYSDGFKSKHSGSNAYPENWRELLDFSELIKA